MLKKNIRLVILSLLCAALLMCASALAEDIWQYRVDDAGLAHLTAFTDGAAASAEVPMSIDGYDVIGLDAGVFAEAGMLERVFIPVTVTEIDDAAFSGTRDVQIRAYNGSAALAFAQAKGMDGKNLSSLCFTQNVVDLTGISASDYSYISGGVRLRDSYARALKEGSLFFIPPDKRSAMGDAYQVRAISEKDGCADIRMAEADPSLVLERISVDVRNLKPDLNNITILDDSVKDLQILPKVYVDGGDFTVPFAITIQEPYLEAKVNIQMNLDRLIIDADMMPFELKSFRCDQTFSADVEVTMQKKAEFKKKLLDVPFYTVAGVVSARAIINLECTAEGKVTVTAGISESKSLAYTPAGGWTEKDNGRSFDTSINASIGAKAELALPMLAISLPVVKNVAAVSLKWCAEAKIESAYEPLNPRTKVCFDVSIKGTGEAEAWVGLYIETEKRTFDHRLKWNSPQLKILDKGFHMEDGEIVDTCTKASRKLSFDTGFDLELPPIYADDDTFTISLPSSHREIMRQGYTFLGWYTMPAGSADNVKIDYSVTLLEAETTIYALWEKDADGPDVSAVPGTPPALDTAQSNWVYEGKYVYYANTHNVSHAHFPSFQEFLGHFSPVEDGVDYGALYSAAVARSFGNAGNAGITSRSWDEKYVSIDSMDYNTSLTSVSFPSTVTSLGSMRFCSSLKELVLPQNISYIPNLEGCSSLENLVLSSGVNNFTGGCLVGTDSLKTVNIPPTCTSIGYRAFTGSGVETMVIPETVSQSAYYPFENADKLKTAEVNANMDFIPEGMFYDCDSLETATFTKPITHIRTNAFWGNDVLREVSIPTDNALVDTEAFRHCESLESFEGSVSTIRRDAFTNTHSLDTVTLTGDDIRLEDRSFYNSGIKKLNINGGKVYISSNALRGCSGLKEISITADEVNLYLHEMTGLEKISIHANVNAKVSVSPSVGACSRFLKEISITGPKVSQLSLQGCHSLETLSVEGEIQELYLKDAGLKELKLHMNGGDLNGRIQSQYLEKVEITGSIGSIGYYVFSDCKALKEVILPPMSGSIGECAFYGCAALNEFVVPRGATSIESWAFGSCTGLETITIPDSVTEIFGGFAPYFYDPETYKNGAFSNCFALKRVICPDGSPADRIAMSSGVAAGSGDIQLYTLRFSGEVDLSLNDIEAEAGQQITLPRIILPVTSPYVFAGWCADAGCTEALTSPFTMPAQDTILYGKFDWRVAEPNADGLIINGSSLEAYNAPGTFYVPDGVNTIQAGAIGSQVERIHIPASVTTIEGGAFMFADGLTAIRVDEASAHYRSEGGLLYSADNTLLFCPKLRAGSLHIAGGTRTIGAEAFSWGEYESALENLYIPESVTMVEDGAFSGIGPSTNVYGPVSGAAAQACINAGLRYNRYAIIYVSAGSLFGMREATAGELLPAVAAPQRQGYAFGGWSLAENGTAVDLAQYAMPAEELVLYAVWTQEGLRWIVLPEDMQQVKAGAFEATPIQAVHCPAGVASIGSRAFANCTNLQAVEIASMTTTIADDAFSGCSLAGLTIFAPEGSAAQAYARDHSIAWQVLE